MCHECAFLPYCGADPDYHHATQRDFLGHKAFSGFCTKNMEIFRHLVAKLEREHDFKGKHFEFKGKHFEAKAVSQGEFEALNPCRNTIRQGKCDHINVRP